MRKAIIVKCQCCGKEVEARNSKRKYCGPECAKKMNKQKQAEKAAVQTKTNEEVTEVAKLALAAGLSYGQYVARTYGK